MDVEGRRLSDEDRDRCKSRFERGAYYYSFEGTGVEAIDLILGAVSAAGKAFHHTESWTDKAAFDAGSCVDLIEAAAAEAAALFRSQAEELAWLRGWVDDLQSGMYINCVYCGHRYGPNDKVPGAMADVLKAHVEVCPEHPMSALTRQLQEAVELLALSRCPDEDCDGSGTKVGVVPVCCGAMDADGCCGRPLPEPQPEQCEWCHRRAALTERSNDE